MPKKKERQEHKSGDAVYFVDTSQDSTSDPRWEGFKDTLKKIAAVPKEEVDEMRAEREREKREKRAG